VFELKGELQDYFQDNSRPDSAKRFEDEEWLEKLAYFTDIFQHINQLNKSLHGQRENTFTSNDNILGLKRKLNLWKNHVVKGKLKLLLGLESEEGYQQVLSLIENHLEDCRTKYYFPSLSTQVYDWLKNP
jgi:hypothetical protein